MIFSFLRRRRRAIFGTLHAKVILLTCGATLVTAMTIGFLNYFRTIEITQSKAIDNIAAETRMTSLRFQEKYDEMRSDIEIISGMPPSEGIIRSVKHGGIDRLGKSNIEDWKKRFATIFISVMKKRPHYREIKFIGIDDDGKELVRVINLGENPKAVKKHELKRTSQDHYFQEVMSHDNYHGVHISQSYYKADYLNSQKDLAIIDLTLPIFDEKKLFGMLVISADYSSMINDTFSELNLDKDAFVINDAKEYVEYRKDSKTSDIAFNRQNNYPDFLQKFLKGVEEEILYIGEDKVFYGVRHGLDEHDPTRFLSVILQIPKHEIMHEVYKVRTQNITLGSLIVALSLLITLFVTRILTRPLKLMTEEVSSSGRRKRLSLPTDLRDEIGELARAFKKKSDDLLFNEEKTHAIINNISDGIITVDHRGKIDSCSEACTKIFGYTEKRLLGKKLQLLIKSDKEITDFLNKRLELTGLRKDGSEFPLEISVNKIKLNDTALFCCVLRDLSEKKEIENMKDEFISTVNHEIRTPLTSIQGSLGLLRIRMKKIIDEKNKTLLDISYRNCERLALLVNDILDIEKISAGKMEYSFEEVEICELVKSVVERNEGYAQKYNVNFITAKKTKDFYVKIDVNRFGQALTNLVSNAAKFSHEGGKVFIEIKAHKKNKVLISVTDQGDGIPVSFYDKIFQRFSQVDSSSIRKKGGTGLGLSITKSIIEGLNGEVGFDSKEGVGTTFYMILPTITKKV